MTGPQREALAWRRYAALLRELDQLRLDRLERAGRSDGGPGPAGPGGADRPGSGGADRVAATGAGNDRISLVGAELGRVGAALDEQVDQLGRLARILRIRAPRLDPSADSGEPSADQDPLPLLERAIGLAQRCADLSAQAERRARRPWLLPGLRPATRNLLVYLSWALLGLAVQYTTVARNPNGSSGLRVLLAVPAVAFLAGLVTIALLGRSRLPALPERTRFGGRPPEPHRWSVRLGLATCFLAFPVAFVALAVRDALQG